MSGLSIETAGVPEDWTGILDEARIEKIGVALASVADVCGSAAVALADDALLTDLNRRYRDKNGPTNVLSFPAHDAEEGFLGDVAISRDTVLKEAVEQNKSASDHATHLLIHGILHLVGHEHDDDESAARMEDLERRVLSELGIADPYLA